MRKPKNESRKRKAVSRGKSGKRKAESGSRKRRFPFSVFRFRLLLCLFLAGCGGTSSDPEFVVAKFDTWKIPSHGHFLPAPRGLYSDESDTVFVLDNAGRVLVYSREGVLIQQWDMPESAAGKPEGIWKMTDGRIAVADTHYHRVVIFRPDGSVSEMFGTQGTGPGQFVYPVAIAQDPNGFLYVGEYGDRQRIQKFTAEGTYVTEFGRHGSGDGEFQRPSGIAWQEGQIYAVDAFNNRIQVFSDDGKFDRVITLPEKSASLEYPYDIRVTRDNLIYVIENKSARLTVMRPDGTIVGRYGRPGRGLGQFYQPWDLTVLSDGRILVADTGNHRLVELTP
jgi:iron(III) transport system ATP-binding protein